MAVCPIGVDVIDVKIPITTHHKVPLNLHGFERPRVNVWASDKVGLKFQAQFLLFKAQAVGSILEPAVLVQEYLPILQCFTLYLEADLHLSLAVHAAFINVIASI